MRWWDEDLWLKPIHITHRHRFTGSKLKHLIRLGKCGWIVLFYRSWSLPYDDCGRNWKQYWDSTLRFQFKLQSFDEHGPKVFSQPHSNWICLTFHECVPCILIRYINSGCLWWTSNNIKSNFLNYLRCRFS